MKIVVVEDSAVNRKHLIALLEMVEGIEVAGEAESEQAALKLIPRAQPDLVVLDIRLSPGNGFNVLKTLRASGNTTEILVVTNLIHEQYRKMSMRLGANGFYDKTNGIENMLNRIQSGFTGWSHIKQFN